MVLSCFEDLNKAVRGIFISSDCCVWIDGGIDGYKIYNKYFQLSKHSSDHVDAGVGVEGPGVTPNLGVGPGIGVEADKDTGIGEDSKLVTWKKNRSFCR